MILCLVCGIANRQGSRFCNTCGRPLGAARCEQCDTPNPQGSNFCNRCGAPFGPPALGAPGWQGPVAAAALLDDDATWARVPSLPPPSRPLSGFQPLSAEELTLFAPPLPEAHRDRAHRGTSYDAPAPSRSSEPCPLSRARSWDARRGPTRAPTPGEPRGEAAAGDPATLLQQIVGVPAQSGGQRRPAAQG